jgi:hypothetical protein
MNALLCKKEEKEEEEEAKGVVEKWLKS